MTAAGNPALWMKCQDLESGVLPHIPSETEHSQVGRHGRLLHIIPRGLGLLTVLQTNVLRLINRGPGDTLGSQQTFCLHSYTLEQK